MRHGQMESGTRTPVGSVLILLLAVLLMGCHWEDPEYYNPLDPGEDADIWVFLDRLDQRDTPLDPVIRQAVASSGAPTKFSLGSLWVWGNQHGGAVNTLEGLEFFSQTNWLGLENVQLENGVDLTPLTRMRRLENLFLSGNGFDDATVANIPHISQLKHLSLRDNQIADAAAFIPLIGQYGTARLSVEIGGNPFPVATLSALGVALQSLSGLSITSLSEPISDFAFLVENETIQWLNISYNALPEVLQGLSRLRRLEHLELAGAGLDNTRLATLPVFPGLRLLNISDNAISSGQDIATYLSNYGTGRLNLNVRGNILGPAELQDFAVALNQLEWLYLEVQNAEPILDLNFLRTNATIHGLGLSMITFSGGLENPIDISAVSRLSALEWLDIADNQGNEIQGLQALLELPRLREVNVSNSFNMRFDILDQLLVRGVFVHGYDGPADPTDPNDPNAP